MPNPRLFAFFYVFPLLIPSLAAEHAAAYESVLIEGVPHVHQRPDFCGEACAEMFLRKLGSNIDQDFVFEQSGVDPLEGRGCWTRELATAIRRVGFDPGKVWYSISAADADRQLEAAFGALHQDLVAGIPSILCTHFDEGPSSTEHFRLVLGYDEDTDEVIYHEPAFRDGAYQRMDREKLMTLWPLKYDQQRWTLIRFRLAPVRILQRTRDPGLSKADYAQHIQTLKQRLAAIKEWQVLRKAIRDAEIAKEAEKAKAAREKAAREKAAREREEEKKKEEEKRPGEGTKKETARANDKKKERERENKRERKAAYIPRKLKPRIVSDFHIVIEEPIVVVGDDTAATVRRHAQGTIHWAVRKLKDAYFGKDPDHVITIWLFKDKTSYEQNVLDLFRRPPRTPFGYYSSSEKSLVMNINTGTGTLVHEIVHPFVAANFPDCPAWFNEGLGSLYEQCEDRNGQIWGLTNWRLNGLQKAIEKEDYEMPTFEELCGTTTYEFYERDPGTNYAQSRYLLYYLQHRGLLRKYYHEFHRSVDKDPTGYATLKRILELEEDDMEKFQKTWTEFVLDLQY